MPNNETSIYPIEKTYQILESNFNFDKPLDFYRSKYNSLEKVPRHVLLKTIKNELDNEKFLVEQLTKKAIRDLINPKYKRVIDELILKINSNNAPLLTPLQNTTQ